MLSGRPSTKYATADVFTSQCLSPETQEANVLSNGVRCCHTPKRYDNVVEISRFPIPNDGCSSSAGAKGMYCQAETSTPGSNLSKQPYRRCCCHHTHHHHHHHTIVINGNQIKNPSDMVNGGSPRSGVLKTSSCPTWTGSSRKTGWSRGNSEGQRRRDDITSRYSEQCRDSPHHTNQNCNTSVGHDCGELRRDSNQRYEYRFIKPVNNKKCCRKPSVGMLVLLTVLVVVIISLMSGLIYFLVRGNVPQSDSSSSQKNVPSVSTVLNQTTICGKYPEKYFSLSPRKLDMKYLNSYPPENDHRLNSSLAARIIGGMPANIAQYPWQTPRSISDPNRSSTFSSLVDASMMQGRIFGGSNTAASRFPWQVHLFAVSLWVKHRGKTCGGSLIMKDWVLTAAHCTDANGDPDLWTAYVGMSLMTEKSRPPAQSSKVLHIIQHPNYISDFSYDYDVSILKLKIPLTFSPTVQPICLPDQAIEYQDGTKCYISGWGATTNSGQPNAPNTLQHAQVDIIGDDTCRRNDWLGVLVTDRMMCAGKADGSKDACQGDSGGPLSCYDTEQKTWTLAGSVSWGIECGQPRQPGVYAKISFFVDWIWKKIGQYEGWIEKKDDDEDISSGEVWE